MSGKRGRPKKPKEEKVLSNGLLPRQWARIKKEAKKLGYAEAIPYLRAIVDEYFAVKDAENGDDNPFDTPEDVKKHTDIAVKSNSVIEKEI